MAHFYQGKNRKGGARREGQEREMVCQGCARDGPSAISTAVPKAGAMNLEGIWRGLQRFKLKNGREEQGRAAREREIEGLQGPGR